MHRHDDHLNTLPTLADLNSAIVTLSKEADRMEAGRRGLVLHAYPAMLQGRRAAGDAIALLEAVAEKLSRLRADIEKHISFVSNSNSNS
jgi:hypothetical protein